jgi:dTDP-glucose 4,6-dehydratase
MRLAGKTVLVTGAGGFVGSHLVEALCHAGASVRAFVRYNSRNDIGLLAEAPREILASVEVIMGDLRDPDAVRRSVSGCQAVFHLGALIAIPYSYKNPVEVTETNVMGTVNVLMAARDAGVERFVHTSTSEVYGTARYVPIDEAHPLQGQSPYSASKIGADKIAESIHRAFGLPVATIRPFNIYGPRQSGRAVIPTIITQLLKDGRIRLGNLAATRDFSFVADTVRAFIATAESDIAVGRVINVGSNFEISIGELAHTIAGLIGRDVKIVQDPARLRPEASEVERLWADNGLARETLGWAPQVPLEDGLRQTIRWIQENLHRYAVGDYVV